MRDLVVIGKALAIAVGWEMHSGAVAQTACRLRGHDPSYVLGIALGYADPVCARCGKGPLAPREPISGHSRL